jgi:hypothetical protein
MATQNNDTAGASKDLDLAMKSIDNILTDLTSTTITAEQQRLVDNRTNGVPTRHSIGFYSF